MAYNFIITIIILTLYSILLLGIIIPLIRYIAFPIFDRIADSKWIKKIPYIICGMIFACALIVFLVLASALPLYLGIQPFD